MKKLIFALLLTLPGLLLGQGSIATMLTPAPGSTVGSSATFLWSNIPDAQAYWLDVGTIQYQGNVFQQNVGTLTMQIVNNIPNSGSPIYVRLWTLKAGTWYVNDYVYASSVEHISLWYFGSNNNGAYGSGSGTGFRNRFEIQATDSVNADWLTNIQLQIGAGCLVSYSPPYFLYLRNDAGNWLSGVAGAAGTIRNSKCVLNLATSGGFLYSGNNPPLSVADFDVTFLPAAGGAQSITGLLFGHTNNLQGISLGVWTVPAAWDASITSNIVTVQLPPGTSNFDGSNQFTPTSGSPLTADLAGALPVSGTAPAVSKFKAEYFAEGAGYRYALNLDARKVAMLRMGEVAAGQDMEFVVAPKGWVYAGFGFVEGNHSPEHPADAEFSFVSNWRPGLVPIWVRGPEDLGAGLLVHSKKYFDVGPAFPPGASQDDIKTIANAWAESYGFSFLSPWLKGDVSFDALRPETPLEVKMVEWLRAVIE